MKDFKEIFAVFVCFTIVFWMDCIEPDMIGRICISWSAGCLGFCIGLSCGCSLYDND